MSEIKVLGGLIPSEAVRETSLLASACLLALFGIPWLVAAPLWSSHDVHPVCLSLCPDFPFL